jgi:phosphoribosylanthranilate isomerase
MLIVKVKICGITNLDDAEKSIKLGADMLGFNFYQKSPRYVEPKKAAQIISKLPAFIQVVGVFVNEKYEKVRDIVEQCQLTWVQFHGDETPEYVKQFSTFNIRTMKAIRVKDQNDVKKEKDYRTDAILFDAHTPGKFGGTGSSFDWNLVGNTTKRIFLAGGINPENVAKAASLGVYGIDVCSGIESEPGKKDFKKMKKLFDNIKHLRA